MPHYTCNLSIRAFLDYEFDDDDSIIAKNEEEVINKVHQMVRNGEFSLRDFDIDSVSVTDIVKIGEVDSDEP